VLLQPRQQFCRNALLLGVVDGAVALVQLVPVVSVSLERCLHHRLTRRGEAGAVVEDAQRDHLDRLATHGDRVLQHDHVGGRFIGERPRHAVAGREGVDAAFEQIVAAPLPGDHAARY